MGFAVGLLEVGTGVFGCLGEEDGFQDGVVDVAVQELLVDGAFHGVDWFSFVHHECEEERPRVSEEGHA